MLREEINIRDQMSAYAYALWPKDRLKIRKTERTDLEQDANTLNAVFSKDVLFVNIMER